MSAHPVDRAKDRTGGPSGSGNRSRRARGAPRVVVGWWALLACWALSTTPLDVASAAAQSPWRNFTATAEERQAVTLNALGAFEVPLEERVDTIALAGSDCRGTMVGDSVAVVLRPPGRFASTFLIRRTPNGYYAGRRVSAGAQPDTVRGVVSQSLCDQGVGLLSNILLHAGGATFVHLGSGDDLSFRRGRSSWRVAGNEFYPISAFTRPLPPPSAAEARELRRAVARRERERAEWMPIALTGRVLVGMPAWIAETAWGVPQRVVRTQTATSTREQWVYNLYEYVFVTDGVVVAVQDTRVP